MVMHPTNSEKILVFPNLPVSISTRGFEIAMYLCRICRLRASVSSFPQFLSRAFLRTTTIMSTWAIATHTFKPGQGPAYWEAVGKLMENDPDLSVGSLCESPTRYLCDDTTSILHADTLLHRNGTPATRLEAFTATLPCPPRQPRTAMMARASTASGSSRKARHCSSCSTTLTTSS